jgi:hypothetical protein
MKNSVAEYFANFEIKFKWNFPKFRPGIPSFKDSQFLSDHLQKKSNLNKNWPFLFFKQIYRLILKIIGYREKGRL